MAYLTNRELRDQMNSIPENQLDQAVGVLWRDSDQTGFATDVDVEVDTGTVEIIV